VGINGVLDVRLLKISSSENKIFFINESSIPIQEGAESIIEFGPKPGSENDSIINVAALAEKSKSLRLLEIKCGCGWTVTTN
jgi:hypothetical protein